MNDDIKIAVIGLGYVGLPLSINFAKKFHVIGFDVSKSRISELKNFKDNTNEVDTSEIENVKSNIVFTNNDHDISECNFYIVTVPTPIDENNKPDLKPIFDASKIIGKHLSVGDFVVYESTVYPGLTINECAPILEKESALKLNLDFYLGYSPERINPGGNGHKINDIVKITSGSNEYSRVFIDNIYKQIISAGTFSASSISVAEAAKVIENTQRDLNIALINELAKIFNIMEIDTEEVINAASTKWNFNPYYPGLVGGHCIGVDPYYLTYQSQRLGYEPQVILSGRAVNNSMPTYVMSMLKSYLDQRNIPIKEKKLLIMGFAFKENCPDIRNTKIYDIFLEAKNQGYKITIFDPVINLDEAREFYPDINFVNDVSFNSQDIVLLAVKHDEFVDMGIEKIKSFCNENHIIFDLKYLFPKDHTTLRL